MISYLWEEYMHIAYNKYLSNQLHRPYSASFRCTQIQIHGNATWDLYFFLVNRCASSHCHTFWDLTFLLRGTHRSTDVVFRNKPILKQEKVRCFLLFDVWWLSFFKAIYLHFAISIYWNDIDKGKMNILYISTYKYSRSSRPVSLIDIKPKVKPHSDVDHHCKDKATLTHTHILCFTSVACWAGSLLQCQATSC